MHHFAYNETVEESGDAMRENERSAIERIVGMLRGADVAGLGSPEAIEALYYLERLWLIFMRDVRSPDNELPVAMRASLMSIGNWVTREIENVRLGRSPTLEPLIEINEIIAAGLGPRSQ